MEVRSSKHLFMRLAVRGIPHGLPRVIFQRARRRCYDTIEKVEIAILKTKLYGRRRDVMIAYRREPTSVLIVTIHPLKRGQFENRVRSGRWRLL